MLAIICSTQLVLPPGVAPLSWRNALLVIIAVLQLIPPKVVGIVVDGVTQQHYTAEKVWMWIGALVLIAVMVYLLRYVWRVLLFGASYQLAVELRKILPATEPPASGVLCAIALGSYRPRHQ